MFEVNVKNVMKGRGGEKEEDQHGFTLGRPLRGALKN